MKTAYVRAIELELRSRERELAAALAERVLGIDVQGTRAKELLQVLAREPLVSVKGLTRYMDLEIDHGTDGSVATATYCRALERAGLVELIETKTAHGWKTFVRLRALAREAS